MEPNMSLPMRLKLRLVPEKDRYALGMDAVIYDETSGAVLDTVNEWSVDGRAVDGFVTMTLRCLAGVEIRIPSSPKPTKDEPAVTVDGQKYVLDPDSVTALGDSSFSVGFKPADGEFSSFYAEDKDEGEDDCVVLCDGVLTRVHADGSSLKQGSPGTGGKDQVQAALDALTEARQTRKDDE